MKIIKLHQTQTQIMRCNARVVIGCAATGSGKTWMSPWWLAQEIEKYPGELWLVVGPTYRMLDTVIIPEFLNAYRGTIMEGRWVASKNQYLLPDGGTIYFISTDNTEAIQGLKPKGIVADECGLYAKAAWDTIRQRSSFKQARILALSTPYHPVGWFYDLVEKAKKGNAGYAFFTMKSIDNPYFPKEEYYRAQKDFTREVFDMRYNGIFGTVENACCPNFNGDNITEVLYLPQYPIWVMSDFNNQGMSWALGQKQEDKLVIYDEIYVPYDAKTQDCMNEVWNRHSNHKSHFYFFGDASGARENTNATQSDLRIIFNDKRFIAAIRYDRYIKSNPKHQDTLEPMNMLIEQKRLLVHPKCTHVIKDIKRAHFIEGTRNIDKRFKEDPHMLDAIRYACYAAQKEFRIGSREPLRVNV